MRLITDVEHLTKNLLLDGKSALTVVITVAGILIGCTSLSPRPGLPASDFAQSIHGRYLRPGEPVLFYDLWQFNPPAYIVVTDERVFYWDTYEGGRCGYPKSQGSYVSVDHYEVMELVTPKVFQWYIILELYDGSEVSLCVNNPSLTKLLQSQVDFVHQIRDELGISVPQTVTTNRLKELNKPVLAEIRARRIKPESFVSETEISTWCRSPDEKMYTRVVIRECPNGWNKVESTSVPDLACKHPVTGRDFYVSTPDCPDNWTTIIEGE